MGKDRKMEIPDLSPENRAPSKNISGLRLLLIQLRKDPGMLPAERRGFVELSGLEPRQLETLDVYRRPQFAPEIIDPYDAVIIGGLSDDPSDSVAMTQEQFPFIDSLRALIRYAVRQKKPGLLSCGGFMIASVELGAEVVIDPERAELGIVTIELTDSGKADPLFAGFPDRCEELKARVERYKNKYFKAEKAYRDFLALMEDTSVANSIVRRFVELVLHGDPEAAGNGPAHRSPLS